MDGRRPHERIAHGEEWEASLRDSDRARHKAGSDDVVDADRRCATNIGAYMRADRAQVSR